VNLFRLSGKSIPVTLDDTEVVNIPMFTLGDMKQLIVEMEAQQLRSVAGATDEQLGIDSRKPSKSKPDANAVLKLRLILGYSEISEPEVRKHITTIDGSSYVVEKSLAKVMDAAKAKEINESLRHDDRAVLAWLLCGYNDIPRRVAATEEDGKEKVVSESPQPHSPAA